MSSVNLADLPVTAELQIIPQDDTGGFQLIFGGELAKEFEEYYSAGYSSGFSNSDGPVVETSHFQADFSKEGCETVVYDLIFVRHHSGGFVRINSLDEAKSYLPHPLVDETRTIN
jgi:hypothetical protein